MQPLIPPAKSCLVDFIRDKGFPLPALHLVDVGVSGGIHTVWRAWKDKLWAVGVDIIEDEIETLHQTETSANIKYEAMHLTAPPDNKPASAPPVTNYALHRAQCYLATRIAQDGLSEPSIEAFSKLWRNTFDGQSFDVPLEANYSNIADPMQDPFFGYYARRFARKQNPRLTERSGTLDQLLSAVKETSVDILKIDTDGYDFDVLRGSESTLKNGCLAVEIEVQFHGPVSPAANVFCNIDDFMRRHGFSLLKLEQAHYGRSALPRPFLYDIPAQTKGGPIQWADAFYARDLIAPDYEEKFHITPTKDRLRNLALILDVYGLEDLAAEILLCHPGLFEGILDSTILDFLTKKIHGESASYQETINAFAKAASK